MQLPNADRAVVDIAKLRDYCLNASHPRGRHKARMFNSALGMTAADAPDLRATILKGVPHAEATESGSDEFGRRFVVDLRLSYRGLSAEVRTAWIVRRGEDFPRLTKLLRLVMENGIWRPQ